MFSLESPYRGDSLEYTQIPFSIQKRKSAQIISNLQLFDFSRINEPSVFEPLKFYCTCIELPVGECIEHKS